MKPFPHYSQLDAMDCGSTCLRMVAKFYGKSYSNQFLRERSFITREGVSMLGIADAAESIGFRTQGVKITLEQLCEAPLPCILHWNQRHFVVLYRTKGKKREGTKATPHSRIRAFNHSRFYISDPAGSKYTLDKEGFLKCWAVSEQNGEKVGTALLLEPTPTFYSVETDNYPSLQKRGLSFFFRYFRLFRCQIVYKKIKIYNHEIIFKFLHKFLLS
jgi:ATP-binding cassette subfamily B protein